MEEHREVSEETENEVTLHRPIITGKQAGGLSRLDYRFIHDHYMLKTGRIKTRREFEKTGKKMVNYTGKYRK